MITTENLYFLLLQVFSSGVAGYITNKYAVNMIFKEYTPLKIGGAVKKNKEKFIEEISDLVERDIINSSTIKNNVINESFKQTVQDAAKDFFSKSLYEVFDNTTIGELTGLEETINNSEDLLRNKLDEVLSKLFGNVGEHLKVEDILSDNQISRIVDYIYSEINNNINENEDIKSFISDLYKEQGEVYLSQIISKETGDKITRIISCEIMNSVDEVLDSKKETKQIVDKILSLIDIKSVMKDLQNTFGSKTIEELLSEEGMDKLSLVIYKNIDQLIKSKEGNEKIQDLIDEGIVSAKNIDLTIFEMLPIHFGRTSSEYMVKVIKNMIPYLTSWIEENREKIETIIDDSIFESIDNIDDELRKSMILKVKDSMLVDFSSKNQIVNKINDFIKTYVSNEEMSSKLYDKIIKFLEETKVKDIVKILEENNLLNKDKIVDTLLSKWEDSGEQISRDLLNKQSSKTINNLINQDFYRLFNKNIKPNLYDLINNNKDKIMSYLDGAIFNLVHSKVDSVLECKINDLISEEKVNYLSKMLPNKLNKYLKLKSSYHKKNISKQINDYIKNIKLDKISGEYKEKITKSSVEKIIEFGKNSLDKYKSYEVKEVIKNISNKEEFINDITEKAYEGMVDNLPTIVDGNVKKVIYDNLIKLDEDEICNIAQSFMGKQLKPLSMFGAFLGSIVGLIFGIGLQNINGQYGFYNNYQNTLIACLILGGVGVMTNVIALWMIFCPYEKNNFVSKLPIFRIFAIGYIPAHKNSFASGMAHFIDNELLGGTRLSNLFKSKRDSFKIGIFNNIVNNNNMLLNLIKNKKENINKSIYSFILKTCRKNTQGISHLLSNSLLQIEGNKLISNEFLKDKVESYLNNLNKREDKIIEYFEEKLKANKSMSDIIPEDIVDVINEKIKHDVNLLINKSIEDEYIEITIKNLIINNSQMYSSLMDKTLKDVISNKVFISIDKSIKSDKSINLLLIQLKIILSNILDSYISVELDEEKRFDELFDGKIKNKIDKDLYRLTEKSIDKLTEYTKNNVDMISSLVIKIVRGNLNFFVKMAYDFANGDGLVRDVIENIINNKLDLLLAEEKNELSVIAYNCLEREIYPSKIKDLGIRTKEIDTNLLLDRFIYGLKQSEDFKCTIYDTSDLLMDNISTLKVREIATSLDIDNIDLVYNKCKNAINLLQVNITENIKTNINEANEFVYELINNKLMTKFYSITLVEISWEINRQDISYTVDNLLNLINKSQVINNHSLKLCDNMYDLSIENIKLDRVLDKGIFEKDINNSLNYLFENKDFNEKNKVLVDNILEIFIEDEFKFVDNELKTYMINEVIEAGLNTTEKYITPLLKSLDLQEITLKEVDNMHPREIHMLFKSFAGDFFKKLYIYGGFGFIFGINVYLSIILLLIDTVYTKRIEDKVVNIDNNLFKE